MEAEVGSAPSGRLAARLHRADASQPSGIDPAWLDLVPPGRVSDGRGELLHAFVGLSQIPDLLRAGYRIELMGIVEGPLPEHLILDDEDAMRWFEERTGHAPER